MQQETLQEELRGARQALHLTRLQLARYGIGAPVHLILDEKDLAKKVAQLEAALGIPQTEPRELPQPAPAPRYVPPPPRDYEREREEGRQRERQADINHQLELLRIHRRSLAHVRAQAKAYGGIDLAPQITRFGMQEAREGITQAKRALDQLGGAYDNLPGDE